MSDLQGRCFVVTGANAGIGRATAEALARRGGRVVLCGRSAERTLAVVEDLRARIAGAEAKFVALDLASLTSVSEAAERLLEQEPRIDVLINNAGVAGHRGITRDGFEIHFGVNHLGHYLLTRRLLPRLVESAPARVVVVSSRNHERAATIDFDAVRRSTATRLGVREYDVSKLANVLFAKELARRYAADGLYAYSLHPGRVASDVWRRIPWPIRPLFIALRGMKSNEEGARTSVHCATASIDDLESGGYYEDEIRSSEQPLARDAELAKQLWNRSEDMVRSWL